jgi:hypothetical protein
MSSLLSLVFYWNLEVLTGLGVGRGVGVKVGYSRPALNEM